MLAMHECTTVIGFCLCLLLLLKTSVVAIGTMAPFYSAQQSVSFVTRHLGHTQSAWLM